jgi:hypothetical protein
MKPNQSPSKHEVALETFILITTITKEKNSKKNNNDFSSFLMHIDAHSN